MGIPIWMLWMILAALCIIGEIFTAGFFLLWFGIGAAAAGAAALLGLGAAWQWGLFVVLTAVLFAVSRSFAERLTKKQPSGVGADRFIGGEGLVLERIDNVKNSGSVRLGKEEWRASSESGDPISAGKKVEVVKVEGTHLIVRPL